VSFRLLLASLFAFACAYLVLSTRIELDPWSATELVNSRTLPQLYGTLLCIAIILLALTRAPSPQTSDITRQKVRPLLALTAVISLFILSLNWLNLWVALSGLVFAALLIMGERRWRVIGGIVLAMPLGGYLLIEHLLQMQIPIS